MKLGIGSSRARRAGIIALAALSVIAACKSLKVRKGDISLEIETGRDGRQTVKPSGLELPPGRCLKMRFIDSNGNTTGTIVTGLPSTAHVPPNSTDVKCSVVDCDRASPTGAMASSAQHSPLGHAPKIEPVDVFGCPITPNFVDGGFYKNASYHFRVVVDPGVDPFSVIDPILQGGPGTDVPANVRVVSYSQIIPEPEGAKLITAAMRPFDLFELEWNDHPGYASLATGTNATQYSAANGWSVVESHVLTSDINTLPMATNHGRVTRRTSGESQSHVDSIETTNF